MSMTSQRQLSKQEFLRSVGVNHGTGLRTYAGLKLAQGEAPRVALAATLGMSMAGEWLWVQVLTKG